MITLLASLILWAGPTLEVAPRLDHDVVHLHLFEGGEVSIDGFVLEERLFRLLLPALREGCQVFITSEPGVPWSRDDLLRQEIVRASRARDAAFLPVDEVSRFLGATSIDPDREDGIRASIAALGSLSWDDRDRATGELVAHGPAVLPLLEPHLADLDLEVARRARLVKDEVLGRQKLTAGFLGVSYVFRMDATSREGCLDILRVIPGSSAEALGLVAGDRIVLMNGKPLDLDLSPGPARVFHGLRARTRLDLVVERAGNRLELSTILGGWPE